MPDLLFVIERWWKLIATITLHATLTALVVSVIMPKQYLSTATALPASSATADKARMFNNNIETLYSEFGNVDDLDRIEGTASLDTIYMAAVNHFNLVEHYQFHTQKRGFYKAVAQLKNSTDVSKSGFGELKIKVWDSERRMAADIANFLMQQLQTIHQQLQNQRSVLNIQVLKKEYHSLRQQFKSVHDSLQTLSGADAELLRISQGNLANQLRQYEALIAENELSLKTNPPVLLVVEKARPSATSDKPDLLQNVFFTLLASFVFSFLLSLFLEFRGRK